MRILDYDKAVCFALKDILDDGILWFFLKVIYLFCIPILTSSCTAKHFPSPTGDFTHFLPLVSAVFLPPQCNCSDLIVTSTPDWSIECKGLRNHFYFSGLLNSLYCMEKFKSNLFPFRVKCCGECRQERVECEEDVGSSSGLLGQICVFLGSHWRKVGHWVMLYHCHCHANAIFSQDLCSACLQGESC